MTIKKFRLIHGLPGAGKTTLCSALASHRKDIYFANVGKSPDFRIKPMHEICANMFLENKNAKFFLTEACLPRKKSRDLFIRNVVSLIKDADGLSFSDILIIYINESPRRLSERRNRIEDTYVNMKSNLQIGSESFQYIEYDGGSDGIAERLEYMIKFF